MSISEDELLKNKEEFLKAQIDIMDRIAEEIELILQSCINAG